MANTISRRISARPLVGPAQWLLMVALLLLSGTQALAGSISLAWDPVADPRLAGYKLYYGTASRNYTGQVDVGNVTTRTVTGLTDGAKYYFAVTAYDGSRIESGLSNEVVGTVPSAVPVANFTASTTTGVAPLAMNFTSTSTGTISTYAWTFGDGTTSSSQNPAKTYSSAGTYTVSLTVSGTAGSNTKTVASYIRVTATADTTPPTAPAGFAATPAGTSTINLSWTASTDNVGVTGYRLERCQGTSCTTFVQIASPAGTTFSNTGLAAGTAYRYRVRATDAAGNLGPYSTIATATTAAGLDTTPPTVPSGLTGTATGSTGIDLSWNASTDNVGVTGYRVFRDGVRVGALVGTSFADAGLSASTTYRYTVSAFDAAGNESAQSSALSVTTRAATGTDTVWVDDALPAGAVPDSSGVDAWTWVSAYPLPFSGGLAHRSGIAAGLHQHYFYAATSTLTVGVGDRLFAYVYLDPSNPPSEVMLQWNDGSWEHRAYWGANSIAWGTDGTVGRRWMGALPAVGQWVRLEVPAALVGLEGRTLNGMAFTLYDGRATWDRAGKTSAPPP